MAQEPFSKERMNPTAELKIYIRKVEDLSEFRAAELLQKEVWGSGDLDVVPCTEMIAVRDVGGAVIGAFDRAENRESLVGFVYGFVGLEAGQLTIHSHLAAVKPSYRGLNLGYRLKLAQRELALSQGIDRITWTFDPLQSLNAHFNFRKLGVVADQYKINYYGEEPSALLRAIETDRLWVSWWLNSDRVKQRIEERAGLSERGCDGPLTLALSPDGEGRKEGTGVNCLAPSDEGRSNLSVYPLAPVGGEGGRRPGEGANQDSSHPHALADLTSNQIAPRLLIQAGVGDSPEVLASVDCCAPGQSCLIEIPENIRAVQERSHQAAVDWREATRNTFCAALAAGYLVTDFFRVSRQGKRVGAYLLQPVADCQEMLK